MKKNKSLITTLSLATTAAVAGTGCGTAATDAITAAVNTLSLSMPSLVVTSPTATRSTTTAMLRKKNDSFLAKLQLPFAHYLIPSLVAGETEDALAKVKPYGEMVTELKAQVNEGTPASVGAKIGSLETKSMSAACYGPSWKDDAGGGSAIERPSGDLGMVYATVSDTDGTACAAGQLNSLIAGAPQFANKLITMQATLVVALKTAGKELPAVGASADGLASMPTITGLTLTEAKLSRLADRTDGKKVYKTSLKFTKSGKSGSAKIYHTPTNDDNSNFTGLIQAVLPHTATMSGSGTNRGMSVIYSQTDGVLTYALDTAANRDINSTDFFSTTTGRVDYSKTAFGEDGNRIIATFNSKTNAVTMHYAWQAGSQDGAVRAFAIDVAAGTEGSLSGVAYAGFGAGMSSLTDDVSTIWASKMYCNWLNQLSNGTSVAKVQGQTFAQDATKKFIPVSSKINFAPTNTCATSGNANFTVTASGMGSTPTFLVGSRAGTNDLTTVSALGTIPAVTVPTYTLPTE